MALIRFGGGIIQASGSIAGTTHARNRFGNYVRSRTKPVNPKSDRQVEARSVIQDLAAYWGGSNMTDAKRLAWGTYAGAITMKNRLGESVNVTGFNQFIRSNAARLPVGGSIVEDGPTTLLLPGSDPTIAVSADAGTQLLTIAFDDSQDWCSEADAFLSIEMGQPQNPTRNFFGGPYRNAGGIAGIYPGGVSSPVTLPAPFTLTAGQKIWARAKIIRADGRISNPFYAPALIVGSLLPAYTLSGTLVPDSTGVYSIHGAFNGKPYYTLAGGGYHLWWDGTSKWVISVTLGTPGTAHWDLTSPTITGTYTHQGTATGDGTLA